MQMLSSGRHDALPDVHKELTAWHEGAVLRREHSQPHNKCHWIPEKVLSIPARAAFTSYAGLAIRGKYLLIASKVIHLCSCWLPFQAALGSRGAVRGEHETCLLNGVFVGTACQA